MKLVLQPPDSWQCGQACVAMAAGVSLKRAVETIGHDEDTTTREVVRALRQLGVSCESKLKRISRIKPTLPKRALVVIHRPKDEGGRKEKWHWMLAWDGQIFDPGGRWPEGYSNWRLTSCLEIHDLRN